MTQPLPPIPHIEEPPNWGRIPIDECGEPLVALTDGEGGLRIRAFYAEQGAPGARASLSIRAGVRDRLMVAAAFLREYGAALVLFDGYRPLVVQQWLYDTFTREAARERPELNDEALRAYVGQFVATPTADPLRPPPHRSGGAADVYRIDFTFLTGGDLANKVSPKLVDTPNLATTRFVMVMSATAPEPASVALFGSIALPFAGKALRRRRSARQ